MTSMTPLVLSMLAGKRLQPRQWMTRRKPKIGMTGLNYVPTQSTTNASLIWTELYNSNSFFLLLQGSGKVTRVTDIQSKLRPPKLPSITWHKPSCLLHTQTLNDPTDQKNMERSLHTCLPWRPFPRPMPSGFTWMTRKTANVHHTARTSPFCLVKALPNWVHHLF
jgi:hypothetical protein